MHTYMYMPSSVYQLYTSLDLLTWGTDTHVRTYCGVCGTFLLCTSSYCISVPLASKEACSLNEIILLYWVMVLSCNEKEKEEKEIKLQTVNLSLSSPSPSLFSLSLSLFSLPLSFLSPSLVPSPSLSSLSLPLFSLPLSFLSLLRSFSLPLFSLPLSFLSPSLVPSSSLSSLSLSLSLSLSFCTYIGTVCMHLRTHALLLVHDFVKVENSITSCSNNYIIY